MAELTYMNRRVTAGELSASIAHEVNQPIGALVTNAHAALRMLITEPPDLNQVHEALGDIIKDGRRVSEVIDRIRALVKKEPPQADRVDVNEAIVDSIALTRAEILKGSVTLETQLMKDLPPILGDRVQFQQVVMNLVMNGKRWAPWTRGRVSCRSSPVKRGRIRFSSRFETQARH